MKPSDLKLRCYAEKDGNIWVASCLDLCLAAQGDSDRDAVDKLDSMINEYLYDALAGEHKEYFEQLIPRRAPWQEWLKYYFYSFYSLLIKFNNAKDNFHRPFKKHLPMKPAI